MGKLLKIDPKDEGPDWAFFCLGCKQYHGIWTSRPNIVRGKKHIWKFDGNIESPTITPSIHIKRQKAGVKKEETVCHSIITKGVIKYLSDCRHLLKGQSIGLPEINGQ